MKTFEFKGKHGLSVRGEENGGLVISSFGQDVLEIQETSSDKTINLFLYPKGKGKHKSYIQRWKCKKEVFEVLTLRNETSKREFLENEPVYELVKE